MSITLNSTVYAGATWTEKSTTDITVLTDAGTLTIDGDLQFGSGNNQINTVWHDTQTLSVSGYDTIDLSGLTRNLFGDSYDISFIGGVIKSLSVNNIGTGNIAIDFSVTDAFNGPVRGGTGLLDVPGRSCSELSNMRSGWAVSASKRYIQISDVDGSGSPYEIAILGVTGI